MKAVKWIIFVCAGASFTIGCASVDVTKTSKGAVVATNPNEVEVLMTRPDRKYQELGVLNAHGYRSSDTAKMHNVLRNKAAPLGADAVVITDSGQIPDGWGGYQIWVNAVAVKWDAAAADRQQAPRYR
jgi:hypothetical protein